MYGKATYLKEGWIAALHVQTEASEKPKVIDVLATLDIWIEGVHKMTNSASRCAFCTSQELAKILNVDAATDFRRADAILSVPRVVGFNF